VPAALNWIRHSTKAAPGNDNGSTQAIVYPTARAKRKQTFMLFAYPNGVQGNVVSPGVNEFVIPNYKQTWGATAKTRIAPKVRAKAVRRQTARQPRTRANSKQAQVLAHHSGEKAAHRVRLPAGRAHDRGVRARLRWNIQNSSR
jgi:hypothetical protein